MTDNLERETGLRSCPFCGSPAELERDSDHHGEWFNLGCARHIGKSSDHCLAGRIWYTAPLDEMAGAIEAWNARADAAFDANVDRLKACEHIADGDGDWETLRNECPSTAAVARLRDAYLARAAAGVEAEVRKAVIEECARALEARRIMYLDIGSENGNSAADVVERNIKTIRALTSSAPASVEVARQCWDRINAMIVKGPLPGNGTDKAAERNGLILATNAIFDLAFPVGSAPPEDESGSMPNDS